MIKAPGRKKIFCVFGTRPEAIKMATVVQQLKIQNEKLKVEVCVTAQHRDMLDEVLKVFKIRPEYDLNIMQENQSLEHITVRVIEKISPILQKEKPDLVLVHGDTSTTFLTTLACFYKRIPVGHVEAGLRSYNYDHPFPEEANRRLTDALCALHFAPTPEAKKNLLKENILPSKIFVTGNTVIDAIQWAVRQPHHFQNKSLQNFFNSQSTIHNPQLILVTAHRRENFGKPLMNICMAIRSVVDSFPNVRVIYPVHLNPQVQSVAKKILARHPRILLLPPLNYLDLSHLIKKCRFVVTDSGGIQEEAPALGKPVLVLRQVTERPEAVAAGTARVVGTEKERIVTEVSKLVTDSIHYKKMAKAVNPYGDGQASRRTVDSILYYFGYKKRTKDFHA